MPDQYALCPVPGQPRHHHKKRRTDTETVHGVLESLLDRHHVFGRDRVPDQLVDELELGAAGPAVFQRLQDADHARVLARPAGLLFMQVVEPDRFRDRLSKSEGKSYYGRGFKDGDDRLVVDARRRRDRLDAVLAQQPLDVDLQVQLAHAGNNRLAVVGVVRDVELLVLLG